MIVYATSGAGTNNMEGIDAMAGESIIENAHDISDEIIEQIEALINEPIGINNDKRIYSCAHHRYRDGFNGWEFDNYYTRICLSTFLRPCNSNCVFIICGWSVCNGWSH